MSKIKQALISVSDKNKLRVVPKKLEPQTSAGNTPFYSKKKSLKDS